MEFQYISCYCLSRNTSITPEQERISIHLMLLFIFSAHVVTVFELAFQYISCYCLSYRTNPNCQTYHISIHLMLLFILRSIGNYDADIFISIHLMLLFIANRSNAYNSWYDFNTSHVTVYLLQSDGSHRLHFISIHLMLLFIYRIGSYSCIPKYFNTSHVTVYLRLQNNLRHWLFHFNTSHVTVYLYYQRQLWYQGLISIHLMLLFITMYCQ